eukprot:CAMPEP_0116883222 /NCGR_PEP_ID=MMETSP0463-20121206/15696_1 /TAXON_ID=181622 /ORGANISM="Strombidinopsis sp, Strain SopsisLIS2011" /LENGTH=60 /DNA_ID=CAMNT_0004537675 /DNA_START=25 /DNA_END=207 /DNA_ORIENTATION=+
MSHKQGGKAGPPYKPSQVRETKDEIEAVLNKPEIIEELIEKLFKVINDNGTFPKNELVEF